MPDLDLIPSEQSALQFVERIGIERANRLLDLISRRFERRFNKANERAGWMVSREAILVTPLERDLTHNLKIGLTLLDVSNTPYAAHQRILKRIEERNARREAKRKQQSTM